MTGIENKVYVIIANGTGMTGADCEDIMLWRIT